jgi:hypothetical protein
MKRRFLVAGVGFYAVLVAVLVFGPQVLALRSAPPVTTCTGTMAHATTSDLVVPEGAVCRLSASTVNGNVSVQADGYFEAIGTKIYGNVGATGSLSVYLWEGTTVSGKVDVQGAKQLFLYDTTVGGMVRVDHADAPGFGHIQICAAAAGSLQVAGSGPDILVGDPPGGCAGNAFRNDVVVSGNDTRSELQVSGNTIGGSLTVTGNTGFSPKNVTNNSVQGNLDLTGNTLPFASSNNVPG